jgi:hypothetical protein
VLRIIFGNKREAVTEGLRKQHNVGLLELYSSPYITRLIASRSMRWALPEACMENVKYILVHNFIGTSEAERDKSRDITVDWKKILK